MKEKDKPTPPKSRKICDCGRENTLCIFCKVTKKLVDERSDLV